ncbi:MULTISPECIES: IclR family transcriptional regulator [unclassified Rhodococcus (in: high G+C Gram-positive bacteria)]|uniref:IclR family transcriptional regulator n=1 Tax=unclassified Rhodococcus (in: high G+C Gram-positive bacteria) TaxID=192944 RepID=UPI000E2B7E71|nr:IclR family transcriptional regulator [Rhodococcus sp. AG1013]
MTVGGSRSPLASRELRGEPPVSMIERTTLILESFDSRTSRLTLEEVTRRTRLPRSTVHRILDKLVQLDWLEHLTSGYCLGGRAMALSADDDSQTEIRAAAAPLLHELHLQTGLVVHLAVLDRSQSVYLDKVGGRLAATLPTRVGGRGPAYSTAGGKSMLAWLDPERIDGLYENRLSRCTDRTITDISALHLELGRIRHRRGLAYERGEAVRGVACVGAAVHLRDRPVAAISLCGDARSGKLEHFAPLVLDATREASRVLHLS